MPSSIRVAGDTYLAARWVALAERRLSYLKDMLESGRWRRYHTEDEMHVCIRETTSAIEVWKRLVPQNNAVSVPAHIVSLLPPSPFGGASLNQDAA